MPKKHKLTQEDLEYKLVHLDHLVSNKSFKINKEMKFAATKLNLIIRGRLISTTIAPFILFIIRNWNNIKNAVYNPYSVTIAYVGVCITSVALAISPSKPYYQEHITDINKNNIVINVNKTAKIKTNYRTIKTDIKATDVKVKQDCVTNRTGYNKELAEWKFITNANTKCK